MSIDNQTVEDMDQLAIRIWQGAAGLRGESGDCIRYWLEKFWKAKCEKTKRLTLRRAEGAWLCP